MFAIDIGTTCLKGIRLGEGSAQEKPVVEAAKLQPLERGLLSGNFASLEIGDREALTEALRDTLRAIAAMGQSVALCIPDQFVKIFFLEVDRLQDVTPAERQYTEWRLRNLLPGNVAQGAVLDYRVLSTVRSDEGLVIRLVVQVIREEVLNDFARLLLEAGAKPSFVNCNSIAAFNMTEESHRSDREESDGSDACLLHVGHEATSFIFTRLETAEWIRILDYGCRQFEERLVDRFDLSPDAARQQLADEELIPGTAPGEEEIVETLGRFHGVFEEWFREIGSTFSYFRSHYPSIGSLPVRLCGGGTILRNLASFLESLLDLPVSVIDSKELFHAPESLSPHEARRLLPAVGIALTAREGKGEALERDVDGAGSEEGSEAE